MKTEPIYYAPGNFSSIMMLSDQLRSLHAFSAQPTVVLCIGSMSSSGDTLGPRVGSILKAHANDRLRIYGTAESPVHAVNLNTALEAIRKEQPGCPILAVDASLADRKHIGNITVASGPVYPGEALHKQLSAAGDIHMTGIVGPAGFMEYHILNFVPKAFVRRLAFIIAESILLASKSARQLI